MTTLQKSNTLEPFSLSALRASTARKHDGLLDAIGNAVGMKLSTTCDVSSIKHSHAVSAQISLKTAKVTVEKNERPGSYIEYREEPIELKEFTYQSLKDSARKRAGLIEDCARERVGFYRGILHGSVTLNSCPKEASCPECDGSGICGRCQGSKQVTCTVCEGSLKCVSCDGTGKYTCRNCGGDGVCPECEHGWVYCEDCDGDGTVSCPDCNGTGNFIDDYCNQCGGSGYYRDNIKCRACGGTGRFTRECRRCGGDGTIECERCDGDGGWDCKACDGTGECSHCHGKGYIPCKSCNATGTCGKCKGRGRVWCPDCKGKGECFICAGTKKVTCPRCNGLGEYQAYLEYVLEKENDRDDSICSLPIPIADISSITGNLCYDGVAFESFAQKVVSDNRKMISESTHHDDHEALIEEWLSADLPSGSSSIPNDYIKRSVRLFEYPVSEIVLVCNSKQYSVFIVGNNLRVFYDSLPSFSSRLGARFKKLFKRT